MREQTLMMVNYERDQEWIVIVLAHASGRMRGRSAKQMSTTHLDHHYSITFKSDDLAVVGCLRALSQHSQKTGNARITWGNTSKEDWRASGNKVTFHFSSPDYRDDMIAQASRLLPEQLYSVMALRDDDPATPAGRD